MDLEIKQTIEQLKQLATLADHYFYELIRDTGFSNLYEGWKSGAGPLAQKQWIRDGNVRAFFHGSGCRFSPYPPSSGDSSVDLDFDIETGEWAAVDAYRFLLFSDPERAFEPKEQDRVEALLEAAVESGEIIKPYDEYKMYWPEPLDFHERSIRRQTTAAHHSSLIESLNEVERSTLSLLGKHNAWQIPSDPHFQYQATWGSGLVRSIRIVVSSEDTLRLVCEKISNLPGLQELEIEIPFKTEKDGRKVGGIDCDRLLQCLGRLTQLESMNIVGLIAFAELHEETTAISSVGLSHLCKLVGLKRLYMGVSAADLQKGERLLHSGLNDTDLEVISNMEQLTYLDLRNTSFSQSAIEDLRSRMPNCSIVYE